MGKVKALITKVDDLVDFICKRMDGSHKDLLDDLFNTDYHSVRAKLCELQSILSNQQDQHQDQDVSRAIDTSLKLLSQVL